MQSANCRKALKYAIELIFPKCIFEFMMNAFPPASNSVCQKNLTEKCLKYDNKLTFPDQLTTPAAWCRGTRNPPYEHMVTVLYSRDSAMMLNLRACWQGGGGPQEGEVTHLSSTYSLSFKFDHVYMIGCGVTIWEIIRIGGLPQLAGFPHLHLNRPLICRKYTKRVTRGLFRPVSRKFQELPDLESCFVDIQY